MAALTAAPTDCEAVPTIVVSGRVELFDTDASGLIFYGAAARWGTAAEFRLFEHLGYRTGFDDGTTTPVRAMTYEYLGPLHLGDRIEVVAWVEEVGHTGMGVGIEVRLAGNGDVRVRGRLDHVHVRLADMQPMPVPEILRRAARRRRAAGRAP